MRECYDDLGEKMEWFRLVVFSEYESVMKAADIVNWENQTRQMLALGKEHNRTFPNWGISKM